MNSFIINIMLTLFVIFLYTSQTAASSIFRRRPFDNDRQPYIVTVPDDDDSTQFDDYLSNQLIDNNNEDGTLLSFRRRDTTFNPDFFEKCHPKLTLQRCRALRDTSFLRFGR